MESTVKSASSGQKNALMMTVIKDVVPESRLENAFSVFEKMGSSTPTSRTGTCH